MGARGSISTKNSKNASFGTKPHETKPFQSIVIINGKKYFQAEFFRRYNLQPFELDLDTLDDDSDFIQHLDGSMEVNGWDPQRPLLYSVPMNPDLPNAKELAGIIIDARHRCVGWDRRWKRGAWVPEPVCRPIPVTSVDHAIILRAYYEMLNRSKNALVARHHAEKIIVDVFKRHSFKDPEEASDFFKKNGFSDGVTIEQLYRKFMRKQELSVARNTKGISQNPPARESTASIFTRKFGDKLGTGRKEETENALPAHVEGVSIEIKCPECKQVLVCPDCQKPCYIVKDDNGNVTVKHMEAAMVQ